MERNNNYTVIEDYPKCTLQGKVVYLVLGGARKAALAYEMAKELIGEGAKVIVIPTKSALSFVNIEELKCLNNCLVSLDFNWSGNSTEYRVPEEDIVIVAPCTFNLLNKIRFGIADTYSTTLVATAIAKGKKVYVVPAFNEMWNHPIINETLEILSSWKIRVILPQINKEKVTMMVPGRILDTVYADVARIRFNSLNVITPELEQLLIESRGKYFNQFLQIGKKQHEEGTNFYTHGCNSVRINDEWMLITSSGTDLSNVKSENLTLVKIDGLEPVVWVGDSKPSSETPLHLLYYIENNEIKAVVHSHCPKITYNNYMQEFASDKYIRYGVFETAVDVIEKTFKQDGFVILKYHGEVGIGKDLQTSYSKIYDKYIYLNDLQTQDEVNSESNLNKEEKKQ